MSYFTPKVTLRVPTGRMQDSYAVDYARVKTLTDVGAVATNTTFTHTIEFDLEWFMTGPPAAEVNVFFRQQDSNNRLYVGFLANGFAILCSIVGGNATTIDSVPLGTITKPAHYRIQVLSDTITVYQWNNVLLQGGVEDFASEVDGVILNSGSADVTEMRLYSIDNPAFSWDSGKWDVNEWS